MMLTNIINRECKIKTLNISVMSKIISILSFFAILLAFSCVPQRQFTELEEQNVDCITEREQLRDKNEKLTVENTELKAKSGNCDEKLEKLVSDSINKTEALAKMDIQYKNLLDRFNKLQNSLDDIKSGSESTTRKLLSDLERANEDLMKREDQVRAMERNLERQKAEVEKMQAELNDQQKRLIELENILNRKDSVMKALKDRVSAALTGFEGQGLTVTRKNGKVYVSMDEKLLFKSGSSEIGVQGVQALKNLAGVLEQNKDIEIMIEGHTDDVPYISSGGPIKDNWDLSVKRATSVVRILLDDSTIDPKRLTAAGRGEFLPLDRAKTPEARAKNRRTEIILTPNLDELFNILDE
jgi:chemotaxis protein MotB